MQQLHSLPHSTLLHVTRKIVQNTTPSFCFSGGSGHETSDKWTRPSPSIFAYCKRSKTGQWEGLGMSLGVLFCSCISITRKEKHVTMVMAIKVWQSYTQTQLRYIPLNHKEHGTAVLYNDSINSCFLAAIGSTWSSGKYTPYRKILRTWCLFSKLPAMYMYM